MCMMPNQFSCYESLTSLQWQEIWVSKNQSLHFVAPRELHACEQYVRTLMHSFSLVGRYSLYTGGETATPGFSAPLEIKSIVADDRNIYAGTTSGQIVAVPIQNLGQLSQADSLVTNASLTTPDGPLSMDFEEPDGVFVEQSAVALHMHKDDKVRSLLFVPLPLQKHACQDAQIVQQYRSLPNLSGPLYRFPFQPLYKSLVISVGKGHVEYSMELFGPHDEDTSKSRLLRDRNEAFQLLVWGHKNPLPLM